MGFSRHAFTDSMASWHLLALPTLRTPHATHNERSHRHTHSHDHTHTHTRTRAPQSGTHVTRAHCDVKVSHSSLASLRLRQAWLTHMICAPCTFIFQRPDIVARYRQLPLLAGGLNSTSRLKLTHRTITRKSIGKLGLGERPFSISVFLAMGHRIITAVNINPGG